MLLSFIYLLLYLAVIFIIVGSLALGGLLAAPFVPVRSRDVSRMLKLANLKPDYWLYDLGSGDGRLIINAAKIYQARAIGYEIAVLPFLYSYIKIISMRLLPRVKVKFANFYKHNLNQADVVTTFLSQRAMKKLKIKFEQELKPGVLIVSYVFTIPGWKPIITDRPSEKDLPIYVYQIGKT